MGYHFFPLRAGSKEPALEGDWRQHSTDCAETVQGWLDAGHDLGLDCGKSDLLVVDLDPGSARPDGLPPTFERPTPRGGSHLLYRGACRGAGRKNLLGPHIDTRSSGGYIKWFGTTPDGEYGEGNGLPLAPTPTWIVERLRPVETTTAAATADLDLPHNVARARLWMTDAAIAESDDGAFQFACRCHDLGLSIDMALALMAELWLPRCNMPFPLDEQLEWMEAKLENAAEYMQNEPGAWAQGVDPLTRFGAAALSEARTQISDGFRVHDEDAQDAWADPSWLVPHLLPYDSLVMIYGQKGTFKSFLALDAALHVAAARPGWGASFDERQAVVYCAGEGPTSVGKFRRPAWRKAFPDVEGPVPIYLVKDAEFPKAASADSIRRFIEGVRPLKPALVVIDTLHVFMTGLSEIKDEDCGTAIESLKQIRRELGCVVLVIHHAGKNADQGARGHSSLTADMDVVHEAVGHQVSKAVALHNRYQKDADERQEPWCFEGRPSGRSLVFHPIALAEYKTLTKAADTLDATAVARALQKAGAVGHDKAVSTDLLASLLYSGPADEAPEVSIANRARLARQLNTAAKGALVVFATREAHGWQWSIPT